MNIGTIPTIHTVIKQENYNIKGVILISPIYKIKIQKNQKDYEDVYSYDELKNVIVPIFIIHGKSDSVLNFKNSEELSNLLRCFSWFPQNGTHTKTIQLCRKKFIYKIKEYLDNIAYHNPRSRTQSTDLTKHNSVGSNTSDLLFNDQSEKLKLKNSSNSTKKICAIIDENNKSNCNDTYHEASDDFILNTSASARKMENDFTKYVKI